MAANRGLAHALLPRCRVAVIDPALAQFDRARPRLANARESAMRMINPTIATTITITTTFASLKLWFATTSAAGPPPARLGAFDCVPPRGRDPDTDDLDRLVACHHHLMLRCCKPAPDEPAHHAAFEAMPVDKERRVDADRITDEKL